MPRVFGMVTTSKSHSYTRYALESFFRRTTLEAQDELILIDNDGDYSPTLRHDALTIVTNARPKGFAHNVNRVLRIARDRGADLVFANNDIVFTNQWLAPLARFDNTVTIPVCNQHCQYTSSCGGLVLESAMDLTDFRDQFDLLERIVSGHKRRFPPNRLEEAILMPFYCFRLPPNVYLKVGEFEEGFGTGGGEDVDYRIRCLLAGFDVKLVLDSYLLHFQGKSTWRGGESQEETQRRNDEYRKAFRQKWGDDLATIFLTQRGANARILELGLKEDYGRKDFRAIMKKCLKQAGPVAASGMPA